MSGERRVTHGLVLRVTETKEADCMLTVLTAECGKLSVVARGARRRGSKIAAVGQLFAFSEMVLREQHGWLLLDEGTVHTLFDGLRRDVLLLALCSYFADMADYVTTEDAPAGEILSLLLNAMYALDVLAKPREIVRAAFELKLLALSGYEPLVSACAVCGREMPTEPLFDCHEGVIVCRDCATAGHLLPLPQPALAAMRYILGADSRRMLSFALDGWAVDCLSHACERFAAVQLEREFRTLAFYQSLQQAIEPTEKRRNEDDDE